MIGTNIFSLNQVTMKAAIQHYFDTVLFKDGKSPKVDSVDYTNSAFKIKTVDPLEKK